MRDGFRSRVLRGELLSGTFLNLGSSLTAEIAGCVGFDWVLLDLEHGAGDRQQLLHQLQALSSTPAAPVVRVGWNDMVTIKRVLDLDPAGIMVPMVGSQSEAQGVAAAMRYPPQGVRGVATFHRAARFGQDFDEYFRQANQQLVTVVQIETAQAVSQVEAIAAVEGVDVLFVGPMDLSANLGVPKQFDHPDFLAALRTVVAAAKRYGKAAGILAASADQLERLVNDGFTFLACGSDGAAVTSGLQHIAEAFEKFR